jgi:cellulose synthase/poly-beta-1,6-N-acetylglucosamine synthase-like glycosyltransferase
VLAALWAIAALSAAWLLFAYLGYPLGLLALRARSPRPLRSGSGAPSLSIVIAVHNGARELAEKLEATLKLEYPGEREILVTSDGSTDATAEIARGFAGRGVKLIEGAVREGKEAAQARAIARTRGELLVFTDVGTELAPDALRELVAPFADPAVGAVSSEDALDSSEGEGVYVRYEMWLRRLESEASTLVGLSGSLFALRRELAQPWPVELASDFRSALETTRRGLRAVSAPRAQAHYRVVPDPGAEWRRKLRTVRRGLAVLSAYRELLHPRHGRAAYSLWGHKVARFTAPFALLTLWAACALGAAWSPWLAAAAALQSAGYALGAAALHNPALARWRPARWAGFFALVHASILVAWFYHARGERAVTWVPTQR